ncbi:unnamed protein product [Clonostachys rosea]|uniref:RNase H type-1 domain-containing protein n=1 Tax=Bionectria ochroleuca TaxID=29856 RepID=A0ABY6TPP7_BIOOC|nr:unnamed protein product [Clonostachys rosea]
MAQYDSDDADQPRIVHDPSGESILPNVSPEMTYRMNELPLHVGPGVLTYRPIVNPQYVDLVKYRMGDKEYGVWTGTVFDNTENLSPQSMFVSRRINTLYDDITPERFMIRRRYAPRAADLKTMACIPHTVAGGFAFSVNDSADGTYARRLEKEGPSGHPNIVTRRRAELRAVVGFLESRAWWGEGWNRIVVITDSEYVVKGATSRMRTWASNNWKEPIGYLNRDLWEELSRLMGEYASGSCEISFWEVPRHWITRAGEAANDVCTLENVQEYSKMRLLLNLPPVVDVDQTYFCL